MYATIEEARNEGIPSEYTDTRIEDGLKIATNIIDRLTGQWFESRSHVVRLKGKGGNAYILPLFPITLTKVEVDESETEDYVLYNENPEDLRYPKICFNFDIENDKDIFITGDFGFVEADGSAPILIKKACIKLAIRELDNLYTEKEFFPGKVKSETTDGHSYTLMSSSEGGFSLTGDVEVDEILKIYRRSNRIGSV